MNSSYLHIFVWKPSFSVHLKEVSNILSDVVLCQDMYGVCLNFFSFENKKNENTTLWLKQSVWKEALVTTFWLESLHLPACVDGLKEK